jgi:phosphate-selective porin OprO/OprP
LLSTSRTACQAFFVLIVSVLMVLPASAEKSLEELLLEKGLVTAEDLQGLNDDDVKTDPERLDSEGVEKDPNDLVEISVDHKGLVVRSRDGNFKAAFGGRLQFDAGVFIQDRTNLGDGVEVRRARIKSYGTVWKDWDYKIEVNFDPDLGVPVTDGWLRYSGFKSFDVTVGHQKVPFSQSSMTSSNWQVFQERALSDAFIDNREQGRRRMGVVLASHGKKWSYSGGVFAGGLDDSGGEDEDFGTGHRFVFAPIAEKTKVLAMGGSAIYRHIAGSSSVRLRSRPEAHLAGANLVNTGVLTTVEDIFLYNIEATAVVGRFHGQAEYSAVRSWRSSGDSTLDFYGFYLQAGVFLTGESRNYEQKSGKYKRVIPANAALGAWEVAARFSQLDLSNGDVRGGVQRNVTLGLNWWANANVMFRFNYIYGNASPNSGVTHGKEEEKIHAFMARSQIVF